MGKGNALYLRLSIADGDLGKDNKDESNSIENQRLLLQDFLQGRDDLGEESTEYIDDGYSGTNFDRPAFRQMIEDAKSGKFDAILMKDFSRLGRDYIGVGDYLEQIFPILGIRVISVNNHYDSDHYQGSTMGLDMAVSNLVNSLYSRDLSKKLKSALRVRWQQGKITGGKAPFGYIRNKQEGNFVIDPEAGRYVRMIFEKAMDGCNTGQIAYYLNEQHIPTPSRYNADRKLPHHTFNRIVPEQESVWDTGMVRTVLNRYEYTGALVMGKRQKLAVGSNVTRKVADSDVVVVPNVSPPIVTEAEFQLAQEAIRFRAKPSYVGQNNYPLKGKIRCGTCGLVLAYMNRGFEEKLYCPHKQNAGPHSQCCKEYYLEREIEGTVLYSIKQILHVLEKLQEKSNGTGGTRQKEGKKQAKQLESELQQLRSERIRQYEAYAEGIITREQYAAKKQQLTERIDSLQDSLDALVSLSAEDEKFQGALTQAITDMKEGLRGERLTKRLVDAVIDTVYVYDPKNIEVKFLFDDVLKEAISEYEEGSGQK